MVYPELRTTTTYYVLPLLPRMRTPRLLVGADLNGLFRFAERRNLVSARVPSHFKRSLINVPLQLKGMIGYNVDE